MSSAAQTTERSPPRRDLREVVYRHPLLLRICHWLIALSLAFLLTSGLQIFNAHPALYWGRQGFEITPPVLAIGDRQAPDGSYRGELAVDGITLDTTGVLGVSSSGGRLMARAFPDWITLPGHQDLATGRRWHFFFAWVLALTLAFYLAWSLVTGHLTRDLVPTLADLKRVPESVVQHLKLRYARGEAAKRYDVLQRLAYLPVVVVLLPLMIATGITMSPGIDAAWPWLLDLFGGRQSARTIHFVTAFLLVVFFLIHISQVLLAGPLNELRSIITGRFAIPRAEPRHRGDRP